MIWESPGAYPKQATSRSWLVGFVPLILLVTRQPYCSQHTTALGSFFTTWRVVGSVRQEIVVSAVEVRSDREVEVIEDAVEDEADQTHPLPSQRATKKAASLRNALNRSG